MTTPAEVPLIDTGNQLLAGTPAQLTTGLIPTGDGQKMALTIRTPTTTLTVLLSKQDARGWAGNIRHTADLMSASGLIAAGNGTVITPKGTG